MMQQPSITLVDQILAAKQKDPQADTSALEKQIDDMVYKLYGLTPEGIEIVEGRR
jgi:adenine-specific DNA-methyltransferase